MSRSLSALTSASILAVVLAPVAAQQRPSAEPPSPPAAALAPNQPPRAADPPSPPNTRVDTGPLVPLDVQVVISRFVGEKKTSSLPYALTVNANGPLAVLRMTSKVPVVTSTLPKEAAVGPTGSVQVNYEEVGTSIDCRIRTFGDGAFQVDLTVADSSVYENTAVVTPSAAGRPVMRSFRSVNAMMLRDGQTRQFVAATDRVSGEVTRIEVTLRVVK